MANIKLMNNEQLLKETMSNRIGKGLASQGTLFLTNQRLIYHKRGIILQMLIGVLAFLSKGKFAFDIPLDTITSIEKSKYGLNSKILLIHTVNNGEYKFAVNKFDEWVDAISNTYVAYTKSRLQETGDKKWIVM